MESPLDQSVRRRRWLMPLVTVLVAGAIAAWSWQRQSRRAQTIQEALATLINDVCAGQDASIAMHASDPMVRSSIAGGIRALCTEDRAWALAIEVVPGDVEEAGSRRGDATHVATITGAAGRTLGLRIQDRGDQRFLIVGSFVPQPSSRPG